TRCSRRSRVFQRSVVKSGDSARQRFQALFNGAHVTAPTSQVAHFSQFVIEQSRSAACRQAEPANETAQGHLELRPARLTGFELRNRVEVLLAQIYVPLS